MSVDTSDSTPQLAFVDKAASTAASYAIHAFNDCNDWQVQPVMWHWFGSMLSKTCVCLVIRLSLPNPVQHQLLPAVTQMC
jgi:hypothetical protein